MSIATLVTFPDLLGFLKEKRLPHQADVGLQLVEMPCKAPPLDDVVYLRWEKTLPYLQIVQPVVRNVPPARTREVFAALCRVNDADPRAGFALELRRGFIYTRRCLPVYAEGLPVSWFEREIATVVEVAVAMQKPLQAVLGGAPAASLQDVAKEPSPTRGEKFGWCRV